MGGGPKGKSWDERRGRYSYAFGCPRCIEPTVSAANRIALDDKGASEQSNRTSLSRDRGYCSHRTYWDTVGAFSMSEGVKNVHSTAVSIFKIKHFKCPLVTEDCTHKDLPSVRTL